MADAQEDRRAPFVIEWRDAFKIDIPAVDTEHRQLFALVKALDLRSIDAALANLLDYVVTHFSNEQALMESSGYPAFEQHLKLHEEFGAFVGEFLSNDAGWSEERVYELRRFLNKWLIGHILTHDMRFGKWYVREGSHHHKRVSDSGHRRGLLARLLGIGHR